MAVLELTLADIARPDVTEGVWAPFLSSSEDGLVLRGDDTGGVVLYLSVLGDRCLISPDMGGLLDALGARGLRPTLSPEAMSFLLHDGQVPFPGTIYREVSALALGDRALLSSDGEDLSVSFSLEFPYLSRLSREDSEPDTGRLLAVLAEATADALEGHRNARLLLSAGKDSTGLALALAEAGRTDVTCVTYAGEGDDEHVFAADVCKRLGLSHRTVSMDSFGDSVPDVLERFFTESPAPAGDLAQIATVLAVSGEAADGEAIVEGTGNDTTFGYLPRDKDRRAARLTLGRWGWAEGIRSLVPPGSQLNHLLRDPLEFNWTGLRLRYHETSRLLPGAVPTTPHWRAVRHDLREVDFVDRRALTRGRHFEIGCQKEKIGLAARAFGLRAVHPFQDRRVIDYYFNLPESSRYDRDGLVNKKLLRQLLHERLGYDESVIGKRGFQFDGAAFVRRFRTLIRDEILQCTLFRQDAAERLAGSIAGVDAGRHFWHAIVGAYQLAAWHNHSRYLKG